MNNKNRITYRFDQESKAVRKGGQDNVLPEPTSDGAGSAQADAKSNVIPLYNRMNSFMPSEMTPWNSPFQDDVSSLEELIRSTNKGKGAEAGANAAKSASGNRKTAILRDEEEQEAPYTPIAWDFPVPHDEKEKPRRVSVASREAGWSSKREEKENNEAVHIDGQPGYARYHSSSASPSWLKVLMTVVGALATGALFGYLLLSFFTGSPTWSSTSIGNATTQGSGVAGSANDPAAVPSVPAGSTNEGTAVNGAATTVAFELPEQTYYMLQYGVFGSAEGRDAALAELTGKGVSGAALSSLQDYRVYAGISADRDGAAILKNQFGNNIDLYVKTFTISSVDKLPFSGNGDELQSFFLQTNELITMLMGLANAQLEQASPSRFSDSATDAWQQAANEWSVSAESVKAGFEDEASQAAYGQLTGAVQSAIQALTGYEGNPSRVYLWKAQSALMEAVIAQKNWFELNLTL